MLDDFKMVVHKLPTDVGEINIYPIGDLHVGSPEFDENVFFEWRKMVLADVNGYVVIIGDMIDNGLKTAKTDVYKALCTPREQKERLYEYLLPLKDRILGAVQGNHCARTTRETSECPLYDVMCRLQIEDLYRENGAFVKINLGRRKVDRQYSYTMFIHHGGSKNKVDRFSYAVDGIDLVITGHTHSGNYDNPAKIVVDNHNECVKVVDFDKIVVPSFLAYGGYAFKALYLPKGRKFPVIKLSGDKKEVEVSWKK